jgi:hypothetical protein
MHRCTRTQRPTPRAALRSIWWRRRHALHGVTGHPCVPVSTGCGVYDHVARVVQPACGSHGQPGIPSRRDRGGRLEGGGGTWGKRGTGCCSSVNRHRFSACAREGTAIVDVRAHRVSRTPTSDTSTVSDVCGRPAPPYVALAVRSHAQPARRQYGRSQQSAGTQDSVVRAVPRCERCGGAALRALAPPSPSHPPVRRGNTSTKRNPIRLSRSCAGLRGLWAHPHARLGTGGCAWVGAAYTHEASPCASFRLHRNPAHIRLVGS